MTLRLKHQVTQLAALRQELHAIQTREQKLTAAIRAQMLEHDRTVIRAGRSEARLLQVERLTVPPKKLRSLLDETAFLRCVTVKLTDARRFVGESALRRIGRIEHSFQLRLTQDGAAPAGAESSDEDRTAPQTYAK
jgi:hypothetical protein